MWVLGVLDWGPVSLEHQQPSFLTAERECDHTRRQLTAMHRGAEPRDGEWDGRRGREEKRKKEEWRGMGERAHSTVWSTSLVKNNWIS